MPVHLKVYVPNFLIEIISEVNSISHYLQELIHMETYLYKLLWHNNP